LRFLLDVSGLGSRRRCDRLGAEPEDNDELARGTSILRSTVAGILIVILWDIVVSVFVAEPAVGKRFGQTVS
jgi:hypothetical protein